MVNAQLVLSGKESDSVYSLQQQNSKDKCVVQTRFSLWIHFAQGFRLPICKATSCFTSRILVLFSQVSKFRIRLVWILACQCWQCWTKCSTTASSKSISDQVEQTSLTTHESADSNTRQNSAVLQSCELPTSERQDAWQWPACLIRNTCCLGGGL